MCLYYAVDLLCWCDILLDVFQMAGRRDEVSLLIYCRRRDLDAPPVCSRRLSALKALQKRRLGEAPAAADMCLCTHLGLDTWTRSTCLYVG